MKIKYLAHASFLISSREGTKIITDPYSTGQGLSYGDIAESADIVTVSHGHGDHNNTKAIKGNPVIIQEAVSKSVKGIEVKSIPAYHDPTQGSQRGSSLVFCLEVDGMNVCHAGDLGHRLSLQQVSAIGPVDILMLPVGGFFTINAEEAEELIRLLLPKVAIPMHYKTTKCNYPIAPVEEFLKDKKNVRRVSSSELEFDKNNLPRETEIVVLQPAL